MNLQQLRYAVEVAKPGSITAAAKNLYMGQPNLSKSIRELEAELGITLDVYKRQTLAFHPRAREWAPADTAEPGLSCTELLLEHTPQNVTLGLDPVSYTHLRATMAFCWLPPDMLRVMVRAPWPERISNLPMSLSAYS